MVRVGYALVFSLVSMALSGQDKVVMVLSAPTLPPDSIVRTTDDRLTLEGRALAPAPIAFLMINGKDHPVKESGHFTHTLDLVPGENRVLIGAGTRTGGKAFVRFTVVREPARIVATAPTPEPVVDPPAHAPTVAEVVEKPPAPPPAIAPEPAVAPIAVERSPPAPKPVPVHAASDDPWMADTEEQVTVYALIVGVGKHLYSAHRDLKYPAKDALAFHDFLTSEDGLATDPANIRLLVNEQATRERILNALRDLMSKAHSGDVFFFYFSGHGQAISNGREYCFFTYDTKANDPTQLDGTALTRSDLLTRMNYGKVEKKFMFLDACFSGMLAQSGSKSMAERREHLFKEMAETDRTMAVFTSSSDLEESYEDETLGGGHGIFTYFLIKGLQGEADRARRGNRDGKVTVRELEAYLLEEVDNRARAVKQGQPQTPRRMCDRCDNFPLSVTSDYDIDKARPRTIEQATTTAPTTSPGVIPVTSPSGRNYEAYKPPPPPEILYTAPADPRDLNGQVYADATTGNKITFDRHSYANIAVTGILGGLIVNGPGKINGSTITFTNQASNETDKESFIIFSADSSSLSVTVSRRDGQREKFNLPRLGIAKREKLDGRRFSSADGQVVLTVHHHSYSNIQVSGHWGSVIIDAKGTQTGDVLEFVDDRKEIGASLMLVLNDAWTTGRTAMTLANGTTGTAELPSSEIDKPYGLNNSFFENGTKDQNLNFYDHHYDNIALTGQVGEELITCKGIVKGDLISINDKTAKDGFRPSKLLLREGGRVLTGSVVFPDGTIIKVNMTRSR